MRIRPPEFETSICDAKYHVSLARKYENDEKRRRLNKLKTLRFEYCDWVTSCWQQCLRDHYGIIWIWLMRRRFDLVSRDSVVERCRFDVLLIMQQLVAATGFIKKLLFTVTYFRRLPPFSVDDLSDFGGVGFLESCSLDCYPSESTLEKKCEVTVSSYREVRWFFCWFEFLVVALGMIAAGSRRANTRMMRSDVLLFTVTYFRRLPPFSVDDLSDFGGVGFLESCSLDCYPSESTLEKKCEVTVSSYREVRWFFCWFEFLDLSSQEVSAGIFESRKKLSCFSCGTVPVTPEPTGITNWSK
ncbi:hypothetical protein F511_38234 [Dorcoceras hygrometricum]|uniref:Uncharacterized protein n=1 Tax=Dorcoceras hygrometricum TaxID=472368 RepID=A0A2Z7CSF0_9LAMI|nr:hypothetical protein F511_38234 [Dorcoceras hygrometricum]